jgi:hypothetical protein
LHKFVFRIALVAVVSMLAGCSSSLYQNEPSTILEASSGFNAGGTNYFLLKLTIYHKAKGAAAFPDGGQPKVAFESIYLFKLDKNGPRKVIDLGMVNGASGIYFRSSEIRGEKNGVLINIHGYDKKALAKKDEYFLFDPASATVAAAADPGGEWPKEALSLSETTKLFRPCPDFDALGLANPLNYISGSDNPKNLADLVLKGLGDRYLRLAAARRLIASGNEILLNDAMAGRDKNTSSLNKYLWDEEKEMLEKIKKECGKNKGE